MPASLAVTAQLFAAMYAKVACIIVLRVTPFTNHCAQIYTHLNNMHLESAAKQLSKVFDEKKVARKLPEAVPTVNISSVFENKNPLKT